MASPAFGMGWILWRQHRVGITIVGVYLAVLALVSHMPALHSPNLASILNAPFGFGLIYLMGVFINSDADMMSTRSGYAAPLFTLPVCTYSLVLWPMFYGIVTVSTAWILFAELVLAPAGATGYVWWPAALAAALTACLQMLSWVPVPMPYLRGFLAFLTLAAMMGFGVLGSANGIPSVVLSLVYLGIVPIAAVLAVQGVAKARTGEISERKWLLHKETAGDASNHVLPPFASASQAQLWMEWKRNGLAFPLMYLFVCVLFALPLALMRSGGQADVPLGIGAIQVHVAVRLWLVTGLFAPIIAIVSGCCPNKAATFRADSTIQPFLAIRPISSLDFVLVKLRLAALSTLCAWAIWILFFAMWLLLPAHDGATYGAVGRLLMLHMTPKGAGVLFAILTVFVFWTWKCQVSGLWIELSGVRWLIHCNAIASPMTAFIGWTIQKWITDPEMGAQLPRILQELALCAISIKGIATLTALFLLHKQNLASPRMLSRTIAAYTIIAAGIWYFLHLLLPPSLFPTRYLVEGIILCLPLSRLLLAPLALHKNRHQLDTTG